MKMPDGLLLDISVITLVLVLKCSKYQSCKVQIIRKHLEVREHRCVLVGRKNGREGRRKGRMKGWREGEK